MTRSRLGWPNLVLALFLAAIAITISGIPQDTVSANHGSFTISSAIYRIPYADGLNVTAFNDHHNHPSSPNRVDMGVGQGSILVAAASGIIRGIADHNGDDYGRGDGLASDGITAQDDALEDNCSGDGDGDNVVGSCSDYNNYVWIEHPNGEWTKYSHPETGTVTIDFGWSVGDTILVGQSLGRQGKVGAASGSHLHFETAVPTDPTDTTPFTALGGFVPSNWNVVTQVCFSDGDDDGDGLYTDNENYTAGPCTNTAPTADTGGSYQVDEGSDVQLDGTSSSDPENAILSYSWSPSTNLDDDTIATPTYSAVDDTVDVLTLTVSDLGGDVTVATELTDDDAATVTVNNVAPSTSATGDTIDEGGTASVSATFTDPGILDTHTATIDWADGSSVEVVAVNQGAGSGSLGSTHVYLDNGIYSVTVTVTDDDGGSDSENVNVTVNNVPPSVAATGDSIDEGGTASVSALFTDPGILDTHTASIDWGDGTTAQPVSVNQGAGFGNLAATHDYGDNGIYLVTVTVTDDDGGSGADTVNVVVANLAPSLTLEIGDAVAFPGGNYFVSQAGQSVQHDASATDAGSDDLVFTWTGGDVNTHFNNGVSPDPAMSPGGTYPFLAADSSDIALADPGVSSIDVTVDDDDGANDSESFPVIVTGTAEMTEGMGWWHHHYSGNGMQQMDETTLQAYLDIVNAVSSVFSESTSLANSADAVAVLTQGGSDPLDRALTDLLTAWLHFASGAVAVDAEVQLMGLETLPFLAAMFEIEAIVSNPAATRSELQYAEDLARRVRHAE